MLEAPSPGDCARKKPQPLATASFGVRLPPEGASTVRDYARRHGSSSACEYSHDRAAKFAACRPDQDVGEGPLDDLGPLAHGLFADARLQTGAML